MANIVSTSRLPIEAARVDRALWSEHDERARLADRRGSSEASARYFAPPSSSVLALPGVTAEFGRKITR